jgi:hypothetical protein
MTETVQQGENAWNNFLVKFVIVMLVFPIFVIVFHFLLSFPAIFVVYLLVHFAGNPKFWTKALSIVLAIPACWGAFAICKWIWPGSRRPTSA